MVPDVPEMVLLPAQWRYLAHLASQCEHAVGVSQTGNVIHVYTGTRRFSINAAGEPITHPGQEQLC